MSIESDLRREYAAVAAQERATPILWDGFDAVRAAPRIFYFVGDCQFLEPYAAKVLGITVSHPPPAPDAYKGQVPPPTG